jgi:1,4-alpha-glucan branching enzyme
VLSFVRYAQDPSDYVVVVCNMTPIVRSGYRLGVPEQIRFREILNTDAELYGGSNVGNTGGLDADPIAAHGRPASLDLTLPPLSTLMLRPDR